MSFLSDLLLPPPNVGCSPDTPYFFPRPVSDPCLLNLPVGKAIRSTVLCPGSRRAAHSPARRRARGSIGRPQEEEVRGRQRRRQRRGKDRQWPGVAGRGRRHQGERRGPCGQRRQWQRGRLSQEGRAAARAHGPRCGGDSGLGQRWQRQVPRWRRRRGQARQVLQGESGGG